MEYSKTVCICIPCFNNESTIYETLYSVVNQTYKNIKIKVFDNASTDKSLKIIRDFVDKGYNIEIFQNEKKTTGEENFNRCIQYSDSDYTAIFHSDDVYEPSIISDQVDLMIEGDCVAVATHSHLIDSTGNNIGQRFIPNELLATDVSILSKKNLTSYFFKYGNFITCPSVLFQTDVLKNKIKEFRGVLFKTSSDFDVWFRLIDIGNFGFIKKPLINYRVSNSSYSFNLSKVRISDHDMLLVLKHYLEIYKAESYYNDILEDYNFLLQKDRVKTNINKALLSNGELSDVHIPRLKYSSFFHFKFYVIIIAYKMMPFKSKLLNIIYRKGF
jgi:glycosyltransferase involved in cell wall biosynthesis